MFYQCSKGAIACFLASFLCACFVLPLNIVPEEKKDTVYMLVPTQPDIPTIKPSDDGKVIIPSNKKLKPVEHKDNLPASPEINFSKPSTRHTRSEYIEYYNITGDMKDLIIACDYDNSTVRNNSVALVALSPGSFNLGQICDIFDFCSSNWSYVNDPVTGDYYAKASETLRNGLNGDCDDFAILLCSMILSIGGEARISFAYDTTSGHAFTEVNIGKTNREQVKRYLSARTEVVKCGTKKIAMEIGGLILIGRDACWRNYQSANYLPSKRFALVRHFS